VLYFHFGFVTDFEGLKYQSDADLIISSFELNPQRLFYSFYPFIIAIFLKLNIGIKGVMFFQLFVNAIATFRFYQIADKIFAQKGIATIITLFLILSFQVQMWNFHLYTESLFISGIIIYSYYLLNRSLNKMKNVLMLSFLFVILSFLRPTGVLLAIPTALYLFLHKANQDKLNRKIGVWILMVVLIVYANLQFSTGQFFSFVQKAYANSWVIWGYDGFDNMNSLSSISGFIELVAYRKLYYFSMLRPYYSGSHNLLEMSFYPIYLLAIIGLIPFWKNNRKDFTFVFSTIFIISVFSILTFINWHGRFIAPILPFFILISGFGIQFFLKKNNFSKR
jgi:hypothetical protein